MKLFLDMDGVLTAWGEAAHRVHGLPHPYPWPYKWGPKGWDWNKEVGLSPTELFKPMGREFWANLGWTSEGKEILSNCEKAIGRSNMCLLSSPGLPGSTNGVTDGRFDWIAKEMPEYVHRTMLGHCKEMCAAPNSILVDDSQANIEKWKQAGGIGIMVPRPWNDSYDLYKAGHVVSYITQALKIFVD